MKTAAAFSVLALVGSTLAAPAPLEKKDVKIVYETVVHTVVYTPGAPEPTPEPYVAPAAPFTPAPAPAAATPVAVQAAKASSPVIEVAAAAAPASTGYMAVVDEWRGKLGLSALQHSDKLEANALNTVQESNGVMKHKLNEGSMGQVLAPGEADDFEHVFVGGWLCEIPSMAGLDGVCATQSQGWSYQGQTGHAEILTSPDYSHIGCALAAGIWACDLGSA